MKDGRFDLIRRARGWDGYFKLDVYEFRHQRFDGGQSPILRREMLERGHAVGVLPYDPVRDEVVLIEQFRPSGISTLGENNPMPLWLIEIVAGIIEEGEAPEDVARRETLEEAGCEITGPLEIIAPRLFTSQGCTSETIRLYCGPVDAGKVGGIHGLDEEGEDIRVFTVPAAECFAMLERGDIRNVIAMAALQWLQLNRDRLREKAGIQRD